MKKVSILMITYNHEKYIAQAIESVVSQKTNFDFELVVGEDFSKDNTRKICEQYAAKYPHLIKLLPSDKNYGMTPNEVRTLKACTGEYIATCEGDDYWIDNHKLQKQVDFLDANPDFSLCYTDYDTINEIGAHVPNPIMLLNYKEDTYTIEEYIYPSSGQRIAIPTVTSMYRNTFTFPLPDFYNNAMSTDVAMSLLLATKGKFKFLKDKTAVYRMHPGGITQNEEFKSKVHRAMFDLFDSFNEYTQFKYNKQISKLLFPAAKTILIYESSFLKGKERRKHIFRMIKAYNRYRDGFNFKEVGYYTLVLFFPFTIKFYKLISGIKK